MRHAFLITAYRDPAALLELVQDLGPAAYVHIHWDRKQPIGEEWADRIGAMPTVHTFSRRFRVNWGSTRHLQVILFLAREALKDHGIDRVHTITGSDRPVLSANAMDHFFQQKADREFMELFPLPTDRWEGGGLQRLTLFHPLDHLDVRRTWHSRLRNYFIKAQRTLGVQRSLKALPPLYGGSTWWSLTGQCVRWMLMRIDERPQLLKSFRMTHVPEEIFFQTMIMDSPFAGRVVNDNLRYIDWRMRNGHEPAILDLSDLPKILSSGKLFARKLEHPISTELIAQLREHCAH
jgi:hypothetical protein